MKNKAKDLIEQYVERFDYHINEYKTGNYNESQARTDFINPFFEALGWDINNKAGLAESYREVIYEDKIKVSGSTKAPDYCFTVYGQKKFFVEAKKPKVNIKEQIEPAYQLRRYGWSAKLPISLITDFEEFAVYDCLNKPNPSDKASVGRIKYLNYKDYIKEFDFIWDVFSKEQVLKGSFDRFVSSSKGKKGTAGVDAEFLKSLDTWRDLIARNIVNRNANITEDELNFATQKLIDRLIFLRICEDRGVELENQLMGCVGKDSFLRLKQIFHIADQKYNSGLFDYKKDKVTDTLSIDDKVLKEIIEDMYYPKSPYEFSVIPVEIMGHSYEQYLGKVMRITPGHRIKIEEKPEVRKAGGVYYTPEYIVNYIVENTVGKLISEIGKRNWEIGNGKVEIGSRKEGLGDRKFLTPNSQFPIPNSTKNNYSNSNDFINGEANEKSKSKKLSTIGSMEGSNQFNSYDLSDDKTNAQRGTIRTDEPNPQSSNFNSGEYSRRLGQNVETGAETFLDDSKRIGNGIGNSLDNHSEATLRIKGRNDAVMGEFAENSENANFDDCQFKYKDKNGEIGNGNVEIGSRKEEIGGRKEELGSQKFLTPNSQFPIPNSSELTPNSQFHIPNSLDYSKYATPEDIAKIKVCDPACGSGSFLLGAYQYLLNWHKNYYSEAKIKNKDKYITPDGNLTTSVKKEILLNNIFGVDIDTNAVEVTKLSLMLKAMEGETTASINQQLSLMHDKVLPTLDDNIKSGNSLIDLDFYENELDFEPGMEKKIKPFNWQSAFPQVFKQGGFDAVIGNPPYGAELDKLSVSYLQKKYPIGNTDTAPIFMILSQNLLKNKGYNTFIIPKAFTYASNWAKTRDELLPTLSSIVDCSKVWKEVKLEMSVYTTQKGSTTNYFKSNIRKSQEIIEIGSIDKALCREFGFILNGVSDEEIKIASKMKSNNISLNNLVKNQRGAIYQKFVDDDGEYLVLGGKQIAKYYSDNKIKGRIAKEIIVDNKAFLRPNSILVQRLVAHIMNPIPHLMITATLSEEYKKDKYIILDTINQLTNLSDLSSKFLLAIINSKLISWFTYKFIFANAIRTMQFDNPTTSKIPIPANPSPEAQAQLVKLVETMLQLNKDLQAATLPEQKEQLKARIHYTDKKIDQLVYQLYELTEEEIKIVEGE